jgi:hypothetical protein
MLDKDSRVVLQIFSNITKATAEIENASRDKISYAIKKGTVFDGKFLLCMLNSLTEAEKATFTGTIPYDQTMGRRVDTIDPSDLSSIIETFPSVTAAAASMNVTTDAIRKAIRTDVIFQGYRWRYNNPEVPEVPETAKPTKLIAMLDLHTKKIVAVFDNVKAAALNRKIDSTNRILSAIKTGKHTCGHFWGKWDDLSEESKKEFQDSKSNTTPSTTAESSTSSVPSSSTSSEISEVRDTTKYVAMLDLNTLKPVIIYEDISKATFDRRISTPLLILKAIKDQKQCSGHMWCMYSSLPEEHPELLPKIDKGTTKKTKTIAMFDPNTKKILSCYSDPKKAAESRGLRSFTSITQAVSFGTKAGGHHWCLFDDLPEESIRVFERENKQKDSDGLGLVAMMKDDKVVQIFHDRREAAEFVGLQNAKPISHAIERSLEAGGYLWRMLTDVPAELLVDCPMPPEKTKPAKKFNRGLVAKLSGDKKIVQVYSSQMKAAEEEKFCSNSPISSAIRSGKKYKDFYWCMWDDLPEGDKADYKSKVELPQAKRNQKRTPRASDNRGKVAKLDENGLVLNVFANQSRASEHEHFTNPGSISNSVRTGRSYRSFFWTMWDDVPEAAKAKYTGPIPDSRFNNHHMKPVEKLDPIDKTVVATFHSMSEALAELGVARARRDAIKKAIKTGAVYKDFLWRFLG